MAVALQGPEQHILCGGFHLVLTWAGLVDIAMHMQDWQQQGD
jgi:hypothetical protein